MSNDEPHEYPKPEYSPQFAEPPSEAYDRGVNDGIMWVCNEARRRADPEGYKTAIALERNRRWLAEAKARIAQLEEQLLQHTYRDDMGR